jgi:hypothetical protein
VRFNIVLFSRERMVPSGIDPLRLRDFLKIMKGSPGYEKYRDHRLREISTRPRSVVRHNSDASSGRLDKLEMVPFQICRFHLIRPPEEDVIWLEHTLDRESYRFGTRVRLLPCTRRLSAERLEDVN